MDHAPLPRRRLLLLGTGTALALVVWVVLVVTAVRLLGSAPGGAGDWVVVGLVSAGAAASLFAGLLLGVRLVGVVRRREPAPAPARPKGGKRAAR